MILVWLVQWLSQLVWTIIKFIFWDLLVQELVNHIILGIGKFIVRLFKSRRQLSKAQPPAV